MSEASPRVRQRVARQKGQDQAVGHHGGQGHGLDDDHGGRGGEAADEDDGGQQGFAAPERQRQYQQVRVRRRGEQGARRHQRQDRQAGQDQIERKKSSAPASHGLVRRPRRRPREIGVAGRRWPGSKSG
jgi:hypothetical protein